MKKCDPKKRDPQKKQVCNPLTGRWIDEKSPKIPELIKQFPSLLNDLSEERKLSLKKASPSKKISSKKVTFSDEQNPIVNAQWLLDIDKKQQLLPFNNYLLK